MKKTILFCNILFIFAVFACNANDSNQSPKDFLCGNWYTSPEVKNATIGTYSWGEGKTISNFTLEIDLHADKPILTLPMLGGPFPITEVKKIDKKTISFVFFFDRGNFYVTYHVHKLDKGAIWFEFIKGDADGLIPSFHTNGKKFLWYKIAGPEMK